MVNTKYKDASPDTTVQNIQNILKKYQIEVQEEWRPSGVCHCYSARIHVPGASFQAIGKGANEAYCKASGYAEFMERLQSGYIERRIIRDNVLHYNDAVRMDRAEVLSACGKWFKAIADKISFLHSVPVTAEDILERCFEVENANDGKINVLPFYNATDNCMTYFPQRIIRTLYTTNGLAAGNTQREAIVQSFSEIIERNHVMQFFFNNLIPPSVPDNYLAQYPACYETIQDVRSRGYEVIIKDCSAGDGFPLIAAVIINPKTHAYHVHMGAHPVFEIALERSLTEMFQGRNIENVTTNTQFSLLDKRLANEVISLITIGYGAYPLNFFYGPPSYEFTPFPDRTAMSNEDLLTYILDLLKAEGYTMLIRDISHLGFPSVRILVPGFSEVYTNLLIDQFPTLPLTEKYKNINDSLTMQPKEARQEYYSLLKNEISIYGNRLLEYPAITGKKVTEEMHHLQFLARMVFSYLEWDFGSQKSAIKFAEAALPMSDYQEDTDYINAFLCIYRHLLAGQSYEDVISGLSHFYPETVLAEVSQVFLNKKNPFERFIISCSEENCSQCRYATACLTPGDKRLSEILNRAAGDFDNEAAFAKIREIFTSFS